MIRDEIPPDDPNLMLKEDTSDVEHMLRPIPPGSRTGPVRREERI